MFVSWLISIGHLQDAASDGSVLKVSLVLSVSLSYGENPLSQHAYVVIGLVQQSTDRFRSLALQKTLKLKHVGATANNLEVRNVGQMHDVSL